MSFLSGIIGGLGSVVGGLFNKSEADKNRAFQLAAAKNSIQWRVQDAQKAGIHPLYALGAPTFSPSPVMSGLGDSIANAGQDISRAVEATADNPERFALAASRQLTALQLERGSLENELLRTQIAKEKIPGHPPAAPGGTPLLPGQGDTRGVPRDPDVGPRILQIPDGRGGYIDWRTGPTTNSQAVADEYGDSAQEVYGGWRFLNDLADRVARDVPADWDPYANCVGSEAGRRTRKAFDDWWAARVAAVRGRGVGRSGGW